MLTRMYQLHKWELGVRREKESKLLSVLMKISRVGKCLSVADNSSFLFDPYFWIARYHTNCPMTTFQPELILCRKDDLLTDFLYRPNQYGHALTQLLLAQGVELIIAVEICPLSILIRSYAIHFLLRSLIFNVVHLWTHRLVSRVSSITPLKVALVLQVVKSNPGVSKNVSENCLR